ncbi:MAG: hypothetical protein ACRYG8_13680 [Janthinobacterium lividum]
MFITASTTNCSFTSLRVVERTFAWIIKSRQFVRDYEQLTTVAETLIIIAATATLIRRWP